MQHLAGASSEETSEPPTVAEVAEAVVQASRALVAIAARSLAAMPGDVTLPQFRALVVLHTRGSQRASDLAHELDIAGSSVTRLCDRLERKELVVRHAGALSRREIEIAITPAGTALVRAVTDRRRREVTKVLRAIPAERRAALVGSLREFALAAGEVPDQAWAFGWPR